MVRRPGAGRRALLPRVSARGQRATGRRPRDASGDRMHAAAASSAGTLEVVQQPIKLELGGDLGPRMRRVSKRIYVGGTSIGGGAPIRVQSMCTTLTHDLKGTLDQIVRLQEAGCEIARVAVPDRRSAEALPELVKRSILPVVADIHFDYKLALAA